MDEQPRDEVQLRRPFAGPLPPPEQLEAYERLAPGTTDRLLRLLEEQAEYQLRIRELEARNASRQVRLGQLMAFTLSILWVATGVFLAARDQGTASLAVIALSAATLSSSIGLTRQAHRRTNRSADRP